MSQPRKTMSDLARMAGVNVSTVSRALNDSPLVREETKTEILRIADEIGYSINAAARNLRRQSSETLALITPFKRDAGEPAADPFFLEMVGAVCQAAARRGYDLLVSTPEVESAISEKRLLQTGRADGLIIIGQAGREDRLNAITTFDNRIVVWGGRDGDTPYTLVGSDNRGGVDLAVTHLIGLGRRRVLFVGDTDLPEIALRYRGYEDAHARAGLAVDPSLLLRIGFGQEVRRTGARLLAAREAGLRFDAVFAASDVLAIAVMDALRQAGLSVPGDVSVIGYDNVAQSAMANPALTTVSQNIAQGGELLVETLLAKLDGEAVESRMTETSLIVRESCGARASVA